MNTHMIDQSLYLSHQSERTAAGNQSLGKDDFMKILIAQLQNQDPLSPMEDREFIAQMASFSSLEQLMNMTQMFEAFMATQTNLQIVQNSQMIGKQISYVDNEDIDEVEKTGIVKAISFKGGNLLFELDNGEKVRPELIFEIREWNGFPSDESR